MQCGWTVLDVEGVAHHADSLLQLQASHANVLVHLGYAIPGELGALYLKYGVSREFDFLKVDIDSFNCAVLNETLALGYRPEFISMGFNPEITPGSAPVHAQTPPGRQDRPRLRLLWLLFERGARHRSTV